MGDDQLAVVENDVADQRVKEVAGVIPKLVGLAGQLVERFGKAVGDLDVTALELADELDVMVARETDRGPGMDHRHHELQDRRRIGAPIAVVPDEHRPASIRRRDGDPVGGDVVTEFGQQLGELSVAAVNVADHIERSVVAAAVGPQGRP